MVINIGQDLAVIDAHLLLEYLDSVLIDVSDSIDNINGLFYLFLSPDVPGFWPSKGFV